MFSLDMFVNLIIAPIAFLLLVVIRERLRRAFLPRGIPPGGKRAAAGRAVVFVKREKVR